MPRSRSPPRGRDSDRDRDLWDRERDRGRDRDRDRPRYIERDDRLTSFSLYSLQSRTQDLLGPTKMTCVPPELEVAAGEIRLFFSDFVV